MSVIKSPNYNVLTYNLGPSVLSMPVSCSYLLKQSLAFREKKNTFPLILHRKLSPVSSLTRDDGCLSICHQPTSPSSPSLDSSFTSPWNSTKSQATLQSCMVPRWQSDLHPAQGGFLVSTSRSQCLFSASSHMAAVH